MTARSDSDVLAHTRDLTNQLDPTSFHERVGELKRGSLPTSSVPGGSRSAEKPLPALDRTDGWLEQQARTYSKGILRAQQALRDAVAAQNAILFVMGHNVTTPTPKAGESPSDAQRRAMRDARSKAAGYLTDEEAGEHRFICEDCGERFKRTKTHQPKGLRCEDCHKLWRAKNRECANSSCGNSVGERLSGECDRCRKWRERHQVPYPTKLSHEESTLTP